MAFIMASASSSLASGFPIDASVTFLFLLVKVHLHDDMWFMKEVYQNASK